MSCKCDAGRVGTNYEQGVFVAESYYCAYGCLEWCSSCKPYKYQTQTIRHSKNDGHCWQGGWNPLNTNMPLSVTIHTVIPPSVKEISKIGYKFITENLLSCHGRRDRTPWKIGKVKYVSNKRPVVLCTHGFHSSDTPSDAFSYLPHEPIIMKVERLGQMSEDPKTSSTNGKVVSRGMKPLSMAWVADITYMYQIYNKEGNNRILSEEKFDELIIYRLNSFTVAQNYNWIVKKMVGITKVRDELARSMKLTVK